VRGASGWAAVTGRLAWLGKGLSAGAPWPQADRGRGRATRGAHHDQRDPPKPSVTVRAIGRMAAPSPPSTKRYIRCGNRGRLAPRAARVHALGELAGGDVPGEELRQGSALSVGQSRGQFGCYLIRLPANRAGALNQRHGEQDPRRSTRSATRFARTSRKPQRSRHRPPADDRQHRQGRCRITPC